MTRMLLDHGVKVNGGTARGLTALHVASEWPRPAVVRLLLERGADVDARTDNGETALHKALERQQWDNAQILLAYYPDVTVADVRGETPLHHAAASHRLDLVCELLRRGADPNARDSGRLTPRERVLQPPGLNPQKYRAGGFLQTYAVYQVLRLAEIAGPLPPQRKMSRPPDGRPSGGGLQRAGR
jgi:hypothetical protein